MVLYSPKSKSDYQGKVSSSQKNGLIDKRAILLKVLCADFCSLYSIKACLNLFYNVAVVQICHSNLILDYLGVSCSLETCMKMVLHRECTNFLGLFLYLDPDVGGAPYSFYSSKW